MTLLVYTLQVRYPGGFENLAVCLADTLAARGVSVVLLSHYPADSAALGSAGPLRPCLPNVPIHYLNVPTSPPIWTVVRAGLRLRQLVRMLSIDAIEVSGEGPSLLASIATIGLRTKVAVGIHEIKTAAGRTSVRTLVWRLLLKRSSRVRFFGVSRATSRAWAIALGVDRERIATIYNCADGSFYSPQEHTGAAIRAEIAAMPTDRIVLCAGRLMLRKGQDLVLEAMKPLLDEYGLQLLFVGRLDVEPGDDGRRMADLMAEVNGSNDLRRRVHFLGARVDMPAIMAAADFLVHVPRKEAFGVVLAEAMAIGLPVIASRVGGIPEVLDGTDSIVIPPNDANALRAAVLGYLRWSPEKRAECIRKGRERAMDFHPDRRADQIQALLQGSRH